MAENWPSLPADGSQGRVHDRPRGNGECPYLAIGVCNKCGWADPQALAAPSAGGSTPDTGVCGSAPVSGSRQWVIEIPPGTPIVGGNSRQDRWSRNARVQRLKEAAAVLAMKQRIQPLGQCDITVAYESPPRAKAKRHPLASDCITDSDNVAPTAKALVDGLVQAGLWASDGRKRVRKVTCELSAQVHPRGQLRITITELAGGEQ
jgi:Holliday junction resolvase RusA-like endonuclease